MRTAGPRRASGASAVALLVASVGGGSVDARDDLGHAAAGGGPIRPRHGAGAATREQSLVTNRHA